MTDQTKEAWTPGPWHIHGSFRGPDGSGYLIAYGRNSYGDGPQGDVGRVEISKSDAQLMVAAPDLYSIVQRFVDLPCQAWHPVQHAAEEAELMTNARAVLSKARGEQ